jgi:peptidoglycan/xylan/chitin deacetylase (PgdA/CDA1 family)
MQADTVSSAHGKIWRSISTTRRTLVDQVTARVASALFSIGYAYPSSQMFGPTILAGNDEREIALTYDDGPNDPYTLRLLEILARHDVRATFFLIGKFVQQRPQIARQIRDSGHLLGNHTMTHPVLLGLSPTEIREQLAGCSAAIEDATGEPVRFFRPPHGARCQRVLHIADELGLMPVMWNVTGRDWTPLQPEQIFRRVAQKVRLNQRRKRGSNILMHDGGQAHLGVDRSTTLAATRSLLESWSQGKHEFVTIKRWVGEGSALTVRL